MFQILNKNFTSGVTFLKIYCITKFFLLIYVSAEENQSLLH